MASNTKYNPEHINYFEKSKLNKDGQGVTGTALAGQVTNIDYTITDDSLITGGFLLVSGAVWGDFVDFQVLNGAAVAAQFITNWYIDPSIVSQQITKSNYSAKLVTGLKIRVVYHSVGGSNVKIAINYDLEKVLI
jgi:hypothetical protein